MTLFSVLTFSEQGVYDIVNNLGSLAARFLFRPVEESAYFYFSQMVARDTTIQEQNQVHLYLLNKCYQQSPPPHFISYFCLLKYYKNCHAHFIHSGVYELCLVNLYEITHFFLLMLHAAVSIELDHIYAYRSSTKKTAIINFVDYCVFDCT